MNLKEYREEEFWQKKGRETLFTFPSPDCGDVGNRTPSPALCSWELLRVQSLVSQRHRLLETPRGGDA